MHVMTDVNELGKKAVNAKYFLQQLTTQQKNEALHTVAKALVMNGVLILHENERDIANARKHGISEGMIDRLRLTEQRIEAMAEGLAQVSALPDPVGNLLEKFDRPNGLKIQKISVPFGVIGIIYESRPNVTSDAFALCFKAGSATILKGGSDAIYSNIAITNIIRDALETAAVTPDALQLIESTDRETARAFMQCKQFVDVLIPRGGAGLIHAVVTGSTIPVIETGTGNCHIYIDKEADIQKAISIIINAKTQRVGVCNACESLVIHKDIREQLLPELSKALLEKSVEIRGDEQIQEIIDCKKVTEEDFETEYLDYIISMKTVDSVADAILHINTHNTKHSEAIITENSTTAEKFLNEIDAACVYVNASTRFTDGYEFGFGAEIGISTQKLHARGPMGLKELTSYKYKIYGNGQIR